MSSRTAANSQPLPPPHLAGRGEAVEPYGQWLNRRLRERGWSQRKLAHFAGVSHSTISRLVSGELRDPRYSTVVAIGRTFGWPDD